MALRIIGATFGRTGTHSLRAAIVQLGFGPCHHMYEVRQSPQQTAYWSAIANGEEPIWGKVFDGYSSQVDWPASRYWRDLAGHYPDAKVILTTRDPDDWYASIAKTILPSSTLGPTQDPDPQGRAGSEIIRKIVLEGLFGGQLTDKAHAIAVYQKHQQDVVAEISADRLLVFEVKDGWEPLCAFLGVAVPDTPFPRGNTVAEFRARKAYLQSDKAP